MTKAAYVVAEARKTPASNTHRCHWPGCEKKVAPAMWGCKAHWFLLPMGIRAEIFRTYRVSQEVDKAPSRFYIEAAQKAQAFAEKYEASRPKVPATAALFEGP